jgi:dissimilatory sulfite reductase (desulfoviridin) alpha/beta subunit
MDARKLDLAALNRAGIFPQKQKGLFVMRLHVVGGDLKAAQLWKVADVALRYGRGEVHLSTRQGIEIHNVRYGDLQRAERELASAGVQMGACGPRVRIVVACPGSATCRWGIIETKEIARDLDRNYFHQETPHKFKMSVTGCPNNCAKATENDAGIMGGVLPLWQGQKCTQCDLCVHSCPTNAIVREGDGYRLKRDACILCGICIALCPTSSWTAAKRGYTLFAGGSMGKQPRLGTRVQDLIGSKQELYALIERAVRYYREHGKPRERFGHMMDRLRAAEVRKEILLE